jgi:uncharacterized protein YdhG (YjbR/CyaY superfamily)
VSDASASPDEYIARLPAERQAVLSRLRREIGTNLPEGFQETMGYGMIAWVVPHALYPPGYHVDPKLPLPFMNLASQKRHVAVYHLGVYADSELMDWFVGRYPLHTSARLDLGKSCIRFQRLDDIPYALIGELAGRMTVQEWIRMYEARLRP